MAREEAIQILSTRDWSGMLCGYTSGYTEALDMAIQALSEPNGDLISRADAIEALGEEPEIILDTDAEWEMHDRWVDAMASMKSLPSAEPKTGEWIDVNGDGSLWRCDQCKDTACCKGNFCPNCGAKMFKKDGEFK